MKAQLIGMALTQIGQAMTRSAPKWLWQKYFIFPAAVAAEMTTGHFKQLQEAIGIPPHLQLATTLVCGAIIGEAMEEIIQAAVGKTQKSGPPLFYNMIVATCMLGGVNTLIRTVPSPSLLTIKSQVPDKMLNPEELTAANGKKIKLVFPEPK